MSDDAALLDELHRYEIALARRDPTGLEGGLMGLIDGVFLEFGASGSRWDARSVADLLAGPADWQTELDGFALDRLAEDVALVTYVTTTTWADGTGSRAHRSSIWVRRDDRWRMRFHQGTTTD